MLIPFILGIATAIFLDISFSFFWIIIVGLVLSILFFQYQKIPFHLQQLHGILVVLTIYLIGFQVCSHYNELNNQQHFSHQLNTAKNTFVAQVDEIPIHGKWTKLKAKIQYLDTNAVTGNSIIYLKSDSISKELKYGDVIAINGYLNRVGAPKNPYQFDYQSYLHFQNIHYQSFAKQGDWELIAEKQGNIFFAAIFNLRKKSLNSLKRHLSEDSYSIAAALVLGYREALTDEIQNAYADTGAIHVLAVSGLHVGIIAWILGFIMRLIFGKHFKKRKLPIVILISSLWLFAWLTGGSPSVLRAAMMFSFLTYGYYLNRPNSIYNNLAISAFLLLLWNPYLIMAVGFQLSYLAVLGIVYFTPKIEKLFYIRNKVAKYCWTLTCVAIGAQIGTLPISLFYFHQFPLLFMLSGLIVIPAAMGILTLGLITILLDFIDFTLATPFAWILDNLIGLMNLLIFQIRAIPINKIENINVNGFTMLLIFGVIFGLIYMIQMRPEKRVKGILMSLLFILAIVATSAFTIKNKQGNQQIIVYSIYNQSAIDVIDGRYSHLVVSDSFNQKAYDFNIKNNHVRLNIKEVNELKSADTLQNQRIFYNGSILHFNNSTGLILSPQLDWQAISKLEVDYIIVRDNPYLRIKKLIKHVDFQRIIFDGSNNRKNLKYWKKDCKELDIEYFDVANDGYLIIDGEFFKE